jgi:hypothetical protein
MSRDAMPPAWLRTSGGRSHLLMVRGFGGRDGSQASDPLTQTSPPRGEGISDCDTPVNVDTR